MDKNISEETPEEVMYKIRLYDKEGKEKLAIELNGSDTGNSKKLEPLKNLSYEIGDFVQIIPVLQGCVHLMYSPQDALNMIPESKGAILQPADLYISPTYAEKTHSNKT